MYNAVNSSFYSVLRYFKRSHKPSSVRISCSICRQVYYCSRRCQVSDWKNHREFCRAPDISSKDDEGQANDILDNFTEKAAEEISNKRHIHKHVNENGEELVIDDRVHFKNILQGINLFDEEEREKRELEELKKLIQEKFLKEADPYKDFVEEGHSLAELEPNLIGSYEFREITSWEEYAEIVKCSSKTLDIRTTVASYTMTMFYSLVSLLELVGNGVGKKAIMIHVINPPQVVTNMEFFTPYLKELVMLLPQVSIFNFHVVGPNIPDSINMKQATFSDFGGGKQKLVVRCFKADYMGYVRHPGYMKPTALFILHAQARITKFADEWRDIINFVKQMNISTVFSDLNVESCEKFLEENRIDMDELDSKPVENPFKSTNRSAFGMSKVMGKEWYLNGAIFSV